MKLPPFLDHLPKVPGTKRPCSRAFDRRSFLGTSLRGLGALAAFGAPRFARGEDRTAEGPRGGEPPHFFLHLYLPGGWDPIYLFDGRSLAMTAAGLQANYLELEPEVWEGENGGRAFVGPAARHLAPYRHRFSVLNGVIMSPSFDGHTQNANYLVTGNPFGGPSYFTGFGGGFPLDYVDLGSGGLISSEVTDTNRAPLTPSSARRLKEQVAGWSTSDAHPLSRFILARFRENGQGQGNFSRGSSALERAMAESEPLRTKMAALELPPPVEGGSRTEPIMHLVREIFRQGLTRTALVSIGSLTDTNLLAVDAHAGVLAKTQPELYDAVARALAEVFGLLERLPFDETRSLIEVTTVLVASEFGRTMRQPRLPIGESGTDHNPLGNMLLVGGKGVRTGCVFGATDRQTASEPLSRAHQRVDPEGVKRMGRPIDFATGLPLEVDLEQLDLERHLSLPTVVNTIATLFSSPAPRWSLGRALPIAPELRVLLS